MGLRVETGVSVLVETVAVLVEAAGKLGVWVVVGVEVEAVL